MAGVLNNSIHRKALASVGKVFKNEYSRTYVQVIGVVRDTIPLRLTITYGSQSQRTIDAKHFFEKYRESSVQELLTALHIAESELSR